MNLTKIAVVMLGTRDLATSVAFYRERLGMTVQGVHGGLAFLNAGGITLVLSADLPGASEQMVGATEVVFSVANVREAYTALQEQGVTFFQEPRVVSGPMWAANFTDPDGHRLSIFGPE